jgi:intracellular septation protein A
VAGDHHRTMMRQLLPGMVLPGAIYFLASLVFGLGVIPALACASMVPAIDVVSRLVRRKAPTAASLLFVVIAGFSVSLAAISGSPMFILLKGAAISGVLGVAFAVSAVLNRPLIRTFAVRLSGDCAESRRTLRERWHQPKALDIFKALSFGWAVLLLLSAGQQVGLAVTLSPGTVMALEGPLTTGATLIGVTASILYVRRFRHSHPELGLLPIRSR